MNGFSTWSPWSERAVPASGLLIEGDQLRRWDQPGNDGQDEGGERGCDQANDQGRAVVGRIGR